MEARERPIAMTDRTPSIRKNPPTTYTKTSVIVVQVGGSEWAVAADTKCQIVK